MFDFFKKLLGTDFMPHGYCMRWSSDVVALHVASDVVTALSYYLIPFALLYFARRRKDLAFNWMFVLFGVFILACGTTHLMAVWTLWNPVYRLDGVVKALTALASLPTAILLIRMVPRAIALPGPGQWKALNDELSQRVQERTAELRQTIEELHAANERLRQTNADLGQFAYAASHDLQEPLRMVTIYGELLERSVEGRLDDDSRQYLATMTQGAARMRGLIGGLLEYSQAAIAPMTAAESASASAALSAALEKLQGSIAGAGATVAYPDEMPDVAIAPSDLSQIFYNLIENALQYRAQAPPEIRIDARTEPDGRVVISVADNGIGIDPKYHDRIFGVFKRLHGSERPGTGIGLALCRRMIERRGGEIWVTSAAGAGATFHIRLRTAP